MTVFSLSFLPSLPLTLSVRTSSPQAGWKPMLVSRRGRVGEKEHVPQKAPDVTEFHVPEMEGVVRSI